MHIYVYICMIMIVMQRKHSLSYGTTCIYEWESWDRAINSPICQWLIQIESGDLNSG